MFTGAGTLVAGESITIEQLDVRITYKAVQFRQPDESLMLPVEIQRVTLARTPAAKAARVTQRFPHHTRFITDSRVVPISLGRGGANQ